MGDETGNAKLRDHERNRQWKEQSRLWVGQLQRLVIHQLADQTRVELCYIDVMMNRCKPISGKKAKQRQLDDQAALTILSVK